MLQQPSLLRRQIYVFLHHFQKHDGFVQVFFCIQTCHLFHFVNQFQGGGGTPRQAWAKNGDVAPPEQKRAFAVALVFVGISP